MAQRRATVKSLEVFILWEFWISGSNELGAHYTFAIDPTDAGEIANVFFVFARAEEFSMRLVLSVNDINENERDGAGFRRLCGSRCRKGQRRQGVDEE